MKVLAWLAFPLTATLLAMCWAAWRGWRSREPRRSGGAFASVEDFRRFNAALGESQAFVHPDWIDPAAMAGWLATLPQAANSGDVYAAR